MKRIITKKSLTKIMLYIINAIVGLIVIGPIIYALSVSFMPPDQIFEYPPKIFPRVLYFRNYVDAINVAPLFRFIFNSFIVSLSVTIGQIITSSLAAYAFAFMEFKGKNLIFMLFLSTMMIPWEAIIISNYLTISAFGWLNTYQGLIVPYFSSALGIFLLRQHFLTLPKELHDAAIIDGCTSFRYFIDIALPLAKPAIGALGIYTFLSIWNQYMWPLLITNTDNMRTVQIGISLLQWSEAQSFGLVMAGVIMVLLPSVVAFILGYRQLVEGLVSGAIKG